VIRSQRRTGTASYVLIDRFLLRRFSARNRYFIAKSGKHSVRKMSEDQPLFDDIQGVLEDVYL
jgi:hypothetical protein